MWKDVLNKHLHLCPPFTKLLLFSNSQFIFAANVATSLYVWFHAVHGFQSLTRMRAHIGESLIESLMKP